MAKKKSQIEHKEIVVGASVEALLYAFTRDIPCFYTHRTNLPPVIQPTNEILLNKFCDKERVSGISETENFLAVYKLGFWLRYLLNLSGKFYETPRDNIRYSDGNLTYKTNKTEFILKCEKIHLFDNIKLNGANQKLIQDGCIVQDYFTTNAKSMEKTWFRGHDEFLSHVCFEGKMLKSRFALSDKAKAQDFENGTVAVRYLLEDFLKDKEEIVLMRDYYVNLNPKLQNRVVEPDQKYHTEEDNITIIKEGLGELCQKPILPPQGSYLYFLTKRNLDLIGTTA